MARTENTHNMITRSMKRKHMNITDKDTEFPVSGRHGKRARVIRPKRTKLSPPSQKMWERSHPRGRLVRSEVARAAEPHDNLRSSNVPRRRPHHDPSTHAENQDAPPSQHRILETDEGRLSSKSSRSKGKQRASVPEWSVPSSSPNSLGYWLRIRGKNRTSLQEYSEPGYRESAPSPGPSSIASRRAEELERTNQRWDHEAAESLAFFERFYQDFNKLLEELRAHGAEFDVKTGEVRGDISAENLQRARVLWKNYKMDKFSEMQWRQITTEVRQSNVRQVEKKYAQERWKLVHSWCYVWSCARALQGGFSTIDDAVMVIP